MEIKVDKAVLWAKKIVICALSIVFLGISIAFNVKAALGTDPISVFFNGVSAFTKLDLGLVTNIINCILAAVVFILDRKYVHIGTLIYALLLGVSINRGIAIYDAIGVPDELIWRLTAALFGCVLAFVGLGAFISIDIGVDPWTALAIITSKKINKSFAFMKIAIDVAAMVAGFALGGKIGVTTAFSAFASGPCIQKTSEFLDKAFTETLKCKRL